MRYFLIFLSCFAIFTDGSSQGCSDAGFCSLGSLKNVSSHQTGKQIIDIGSTVGIGQQQTFTISPYIQYTMQIGGKLSVTGKVTANYASGFLGRVFNAGDFYAVATYAIKNTEPAAIRLLGGFKIPFTAANAKNANGKPLPLDYQPSIGTYDFIGGINYIVNQRLELDVAVQAPVVQVNRNTFFPDEYSDIRVNEFAPTNNFRRKADVLLRTGYYIPLGSTVTIKPNLLGIYHLGRDTYENRFGKITSIQHSEGLTLNAGIVISKQFKNATQFEFIAATPFVVREIRPDGLTREAAFSLQYSISF